MSDDLEALVDRVIAYMVICLTICMAIGSVCMLIAGLIHLYRFAFN